MSETNFCEAHGCTLPASIRAGGVTVCYLHGAIRERSEWDRATARAKRQPGLIEAIDRLRRGVSEIEVETGMAGVMHLLPPGAKLDRHSCLRAAEATLVNECTAQESDGSSLADQLPVEMTILSSQEKRDRAIENMRVFRYTRPDWFEIARRLYVRIYGHEPRIDSPADRLRESVRQTVIESDPAFAAMAGES